MLISYLSRLDLKQVYSIVDNVVRVTLIDADHPLFECNLMSKLEKADLYEYCEESRISMVCDMPGERMLAHRTSVNALVRITTTSA